MNLDRPDLDHLVIERANGRITQPITSPRMLYHLLVNLCPVVPQDATWSIVKAKEVSG